MNRIEAHSPAAYSQIQIGDRLRMVSSAFDGGRPAMANNPLHAASQQQDRVSSVGSPLHASHRPIPEVAAYLKRRMASNAALKNQWLDAQVRLVFERPSLQEWEQRAEAAEEAEAPSVSGARVGVSCSVAASPEGSAAVGAGRSMVAQFSCLQQVASWP